MAKKCIFAKILRQIFPQNIMGNLRPEILHTTRPLEHFQRSESCTTKLSWMGVFSFLLGNFDERKKFVNFVNFEVSSR